MLLLKPDAAYEETIETRIGQSIHKGFKTRMPEHETPFIAAEVLPEFRIENNEEISYSDNYIDVQAGETVCIVAKRKGGLKADAFSLTDFSGREKKI